ncbi:hypothetical protein [Prevotella melaninogenica]|jgi:hypothetical protein|uniref:hypothetical protein n=1 Tax=Prevotella melaninogenica TaxID=28132 RepID=UPI00242C2EF5|nr:hypothetical protein [Prevotella melaninogenica]
MKAKLFLGGVLLLLFASCSTDDVLPPSVTTEKSESPKTNLTALFKSSDKESLKNTILDAKQLTRSTPSQDYVSLLDIVQDNDPILLQFTKEEQEYIKKNHLTYYDIFNYEDLVPNLNFARLLNSRGEIQVKDSIYKITPYGTLSTSIDNREELDIAIKKLENGTFDKKSMNAVNLKGSYSTLKEDGTVVPMTRTSIENIPYSNFPSYSSDSHTFVGKILGGVFGDRSVKHHDFMKGYRIKGSLYDYDYGVYSEVGTFVASRKKRGGFFRKLNGWKGTNAEELTITYRGVVLELDLKIPKLEFPKAPTLVSENTTLDIAGLDKPVPCIDIWGMEITDQQIMNLAGQGLKEGLKKLSDMVNKNVNPNARAVRFLTPNKVYVVILDNQINEYNVDQVRKVFNSQVKFFLSLDMIKNPFSFKSLFDFMSGVRNLPVKRMKAGQVILAGKINGTWGGMNISKK